MSQISPINWSDFKSTLEQNPDLPCNSSSLPLSNRSWNWWLLRRRAASLAQDVVNQIKEL